MKQTPIIRAPKGFNFKIVDQNNSKNHKIDRKRPGIVNVQLYDLSHNFKAGYIQLAPIGNQWYETHSYLDIGYRNRGLGALMYARAIKWCFDNGYRCRSSFSSSWLAQNMWNGKKLRKFFNVKKRSTSYGATAWYPSIK